MTSKEWEDLGKWERHMHAIYMGEADGMVMVGNRFIRDPIEDIGRWCAARYRRLQVQNGTFRAGQRMRKDGCPLELALAVLCHR
jgi:hypothetical protein